VNKNGQVDLLTTALLVSAKIAAIRLDCLSKPVTAFGMSFQSFNSETADSKVSLT
jgi:hypothetical protein